MSIRVLHFLKTAVGAAWALRQTRELVKLGIEVHVAMPAGELVREYENVGAVVHVLDASLNVRRPFSNLKTFSKIRRLVNNVAPDLIHCHFVTNILAVRFALGRSHPVKRIFHVPGPLHLEHAFFRWAEIASSGVSDYWLASCEWTRGRYIKSGVSNERLGLVYYGIDMPSGVPFRSGKLRKEFNIDESAPVVGNVAYLYPPKRYLGQTVGLKGHEDLIAAIDIVGRKIPGLTCFLVGGPWGDSGAYFDNVKNMADKVRNAQVIMTGFRSDVQEIYSDFDVAVHPSHSENVGGALESLVHGVPTIATKVGGFPDLVIPNLTGWLVAPKKPTELADAIMNAFSDLEYSKLLASQGRDRAKEMFDIKKNANDIFHYYNALMNDGCLTPEIGGA